MKTIDHNGYQLRELTVGVVREIRALKPTDDEMPFLIAERLIWKDGAPLGKAGVDALDMAEFEDLVARLPGAMGNAAKANSTAASTNSPSP